MNHLIAKRGDRNTGYGKLLSRKDFYCLPDDIGNKVRYTCDYKLEENEWFCIEKFALLFLYYIKNQQLAVVRCNC